MSVIANDNIRNYIESQGHQHVYIDGDNLIRDLYVEDMFDTLFEDRELDDGFKQNFITYMVAMFDATESNVPDRLFTDGEYAKQYIRTLFGLCHIRPYDHADDECFGHCTHTAITRTQFATDGVLIVHAPSLLRAALLTIVSVMRWRADLHFQEMISAEPGMCDDDQATDN